MRLSYSAPPACAACYGQDPKARHVDFEAAYDGPVLNATGEAPMQVDDLIICENCVRNAATLVGMIEASDDAAASKIERIERELAQERKERIDLSQRLQTIKAVTAE